MQTSINNEVIKLNVDPRPFIKISDDVQIFLDKTGKAAIKTKADFENAGALRQEIRKYLKAIEDQRKEIVAPLNEVKDQIQAIAKGLTDPLDKALKAINDGMIAWQREEEKRIAAQNEKKVEKALNEGKSLEDVKLKETTKVDGFSVQKRWRAEVIDFKLLPDEYKIIDEVKLNKFATVTGGAVQLPGVRFYQVEIASGRIA